MNLRAVIHPKLYDQILYVPSHLMEQKAPLGYPNGCQAGYISLIAHDNVWCRFWEWDAELREFTNELRTKANAELVPLRSLFYYRCKAQSLVIETQESLILPGVLDVHDVITSIRRSIYGSDR